MVIETMPKPGSSNSIDLHWIIAAIGGILLIVSSRFAGLPLRVDWQLFLWQFWGGMAIRAVFAAVLLYLVGFPLSETVRPVFIHYKQQKARIPAFLLFAAWMLLLFGPVVGGMIVVDGLALAELVDRCSGWSGSITRVIRSVVWPSIYLFFGLVGMFCYNDLIASVKFIGAYDGFFLKVDSLLLNGHSVSGIAHLLASRFPAQVFEIAEFIYYGMFGQIGSALVLTAVFLGRRESCRFVGTVLIAYVIALAAFYLWPTIGPFYTRSSHSLPANLMTYEYQQNAILKAKLLMTSYKTSNIIGPDYFVAFPCMHIAQPLVVMWFLRRWKRITCALILYDIVLIPAILLLEWHYLADVIAGVLVAGVAIGLGSITLGRTGRSGQFPGSLDAPHASTGNF